MSFDLVISGINVSFKQFVDDLLINIPEFEDKNFDDFLIPTKDPKINKLKGKIFEFFIYRIIEKNMIIANINMTFISFSKEAYFTLSDDCIDIHGQYESLIFSIQCKFKNPKYKIPVSEIREFLNLVNRKNNSDHIGFFVSNVGLSEYALRELNNSLLEKKNLYKKENSEKGDEERKRKIIELEHENNILKKANKKIKEERNKRYEDSVEELKKENEELKKKIEEINEKLNNQSLEFNTKLDLILNRLN
ncbi:1063_t:CDS:2 [Cetraspora pellucida]|uniref:1063_t:CDS:1 n=1 Tax=Cetraspora pellucida TaxID=1433469 RepID=A0A9N9N6H1_9GLOM|nr:1063_t:CDS:2 [Cetraspora pellucida]